MLVGVWERVCAVVLLIRGKGLVWGWFGIGLGVCGGIPYHDSFGCGVRVLVGCEVYLLVWSLVMEE